MTKKLQDDVDLAFVLLSEARVPDPEQVVAAAARFGIPLTFDPSITEDEEGQIQFYERDGERELIVMLMKMPHPDAREMAYGISSPDPEAADASPAHLILTVPAKATDVRARDLRIAHLTAAVVGACPAVGAMLGHGKVFHQPDLFQEIEPGALEDRLPVEVMVDLTVGKESETTLSILSHGMGRYGREEVAVYGPLQQPNEAYDFAVTMVAWMVGDPDMHLPTGDTVGRTPEEKIPVDRGPSPIDPEQTVMVLRLPE